MSAYRGNRRVAAGLAFVGWIAFSVAISTTPGETEARRAWTTAAGSTGVIVCSLLIVWILSIRLELTAEGLLYKSVFGSREIFWVDVEHVWLSVRTYGIHGIPLGTRRYVSIAPRNGRRFILGNSIAKTDQMMSEVAQLAQPHLYAWMIGALNTGQTLDLGAVRLSRLTGLEMKGFFGFATIPLDQIERYQVNGEFAVWTRGARGARKVDGDAVANLHALEAVLDAMLKNPAPKGQTPFREASATSSSPRA